MQFCALTGKTQVSPQNAVLNKISKKYNSFFNVLVLDSKDKGFYVAPLSNWGNKL